MAQKANIKIDTIYYDKNWKAAQSPLFADYYRLTMYDANCPQAGYKTRDYYITGELQGEGTCLQLDAEDDEKTVWQGKVVTYFKSGKLSSERTYENGKLNGYTTSYFENGLVETKIPFLNGLKDGIALIFSKDGSRCKRMEYAKDQLKYDYYEMIDINGLHSKFYHNSNTIKWESPDESNIKHLHTNGEQMLYYKNNGLFVGLRLSKSQPKYYRVDVLLMNNSYEAIEFHPGLISSSLLSDKGDEIPSNPLSFDEYSKKIGIRAALSVLGSSLLGGINAIAESQEAARSTSKTTVNSNYGGASISAGVGAAVGSGGWAVGGGVGATAYAGESNTTISTESYNGYAAFQTKMAIQDRVNASNEELIANVASHIQDYLKSNTLQPGDTLSGFIMIPMKKKCSQLSVTVSINNAQYKYIWK